MNLCKYVKDGTVVHVKIKERDINKRSKIVLMPERNTKKARNK